MVHLIRSLISLQNRKDANQFMQDNLKSVDVTASENVSMDDTVKQKGC